MAHPIGLLLVITKCNDEAVVIESLVPTPSWDGANVQVVWSHIMWFDSRRPRNEKRDAKVCPCEKETLKKILTLNPILIFQCPSSEIRPSPVHTRYYLRQGYGGRVFICLSLDGVATTFFARFPESPLFSFVPTKRRCLS